MESRGVGKHDKVIGDAQVTESTLVVAGQGTGVDVIASEEEMPMVDVFIGVDALDDTVVIKTL